MKAAALAALWVALFAGCGDSGSTPDGGRDGDIGDPDAPIDADPNVRGTVTVRVIDKNGSPVPGMYVVFIDRDATVTSLSTDAAGSAQLDVYPNASVTAVRARGMTYSLTTVQALVPGDVVTLISAAGDVSVSEDPFAQRLVPLPSADIVASPNGATKSGSTATYTTYAPHGLAVGDRVIVKGVQVSGYDGAWTVSGTPSTTSFTANIGSGGLSNSGSGPIGATAAKAAAFNLSFSPYTGAASYEVRSRCGTLDIGTLTSGQFFFPVSCMTSSVDFEVLAKNSSGGVLAWTQKPNVAFSDGGSTAITDTWHALAPITATYTNPTDKVTDVEVSRYSPYARGTQLAGMSGSATSTTMLTFNSSQPAQAAIVTQLTCPSGASATCVSTMGGTARQIISEIVDGSATSYALDIGANLLPWVKALYVPQTTTLEVTATGTQPYDIFEANLRYTRGQVIYTWRVFGPVAQTVAFPALPADAPGNPTIVPTDIMSNYQVYVGESDAIGGYRDAIKNVYEALGAAEATANPSAKLYSGTKNRFSRWN